MIIVMKLIACILLLFNGFTALYGGWNLMVYPDGSRLGLSIDYLKYSPFHDYLIPGVCLFIANGIGSFFVLTVILVGKLKSSLFIKTQGSVLLIWIIVQSLMFDFVSALQFIYGSLGVILVVLGLYLANSEKKSSKYPGSLYI